MFYAQLQFNETFSLARPLAETGKKSNLRVENIPTCCERVSNFIFVFHIGTKKNKKRVLLQ